MFLISSLALVGIYLTLSRGTGLGIYLSILFLCVAKKQKFLTTLLIAILVIFPFVMPKNIKQWAKEVRYNPVVFMFNQDRISMYRNTINMIKHHPLIGVGVNTFSLNYAKYKLKNVEKDFPTQDTTYTHDIYLQMAGETGLLGLGAFIWFLVALFQSGLKSYIRLNDEFLKSVSLSLLACLIAFLTNGLTETSLYYARVSMVFWYIAGIILALKKFENAK